MRVWTACILEIRKLPELEVECSMCEDFFSSPVKTGRKGLMT